MILFGNEFVFDAVKDVVDGECIPIGGGKWRCIVDSSFILPVVYEWLKDNVDFMGVTGRYVIKKSDGYYFYAVVYNREELADLERGIWSKYVMWIDVAGGKFSGVVVDIVDPVVWDDVVGYLLDTPTLGWGVGKWDSRYNAFL